MAWTYAEAKRWLDSRGGSIVRSNVDGGLHVRVVVDGVGASAVGTATDAELESLIAELAEEIRGRLPPKRG